MELFLLKTSDATTEQRIENLLAGLIISAEARKYLECGLNTPAMCVVDRGDRRQVIYGNLNDVAGFFDGMNVPVEWNLEAAENGDDVPNDWEDEWDYVEVSADNAVGLTYETRSDM